MLISYTFNTFPTDYVPTVLDNFSANVSCGRREHCQLGSVGYSRTRGLQQTVPIELPWC